ncbi:hypothetical protein BU16DRAFT_310101 [Lophium mytilinum]|uniref:Uncharacterized protein n=1 Tax=Lophium mytilinum TaxID=390894 RepID=A0A6A6R2L9_9PEZI|nr:hypothetical protein BU16DRAFT_310101 [Lophium mytilinum]
MLEAAIRYLAVTRSDAGIKSLFSRSIIKLEGVRHITDNICRIRSAIMTNIISSCHNFIRYRSTAGMSRCKHHEKQTACDAMAAGCLMQGLNAFEFRLWPLRPDPETLQISVHDLILKLGEVTLLTHPNHQKCAVNAEFHETLALCLNIDRHLDDEDQEWLVSAIEVLPKHHKEHFASFDAKVALEDPVIWRSSAVGRMGFLEKDGIGLFVQRDLDGDFGTVFHYDEYFPDDSEDDIWSDQDPDEVLLSEPTEEYSQSSHESDYTSDVVGDEEDEFAAPPPSYHTEKDEQTNCIRIGHATPALDPRRKLGRPPKKKHTAELGRPAKSVGLRSVDVVPDSPHNYAATTLSTPSLRNSTSNPIQERPYAFDYDRNPPPSVIDVEEDQIASSMSQPIAKSFDLPSNDEHKRDMAQFINSTDPTTYKYIRGNKEFASLSVSRREELAHGNAINGRYGEDQVIPCEHCQDDEDVKLSGVGCRRYRQGLFTSSGRAYSSKCNWCWVKSKFCGYGRVKRVRLRLTRPPASSNILSIHSLMLDYRRFFQMNAPEQDLARVCDDDEFDHLSEARRQTLAHARLINDQYGEDQSTPCEGCQDDDKIPRDGVGCRRYHTRSIGDKNINKCNWCRINERQCCVKEYDEDKAQPTSTSPDLKRFFAELLTHARFEAESLQLTDGSVSSTGEQDDDDLPSAEEHRLEFDRLLKVNASESDPAHMYSDEEFARLYRNRRNTLAHVRLINGRYGEDRVEGCSTCQTDESVPKNGVGCRVYRAEFAAADKMYHPCNWCRLKQGRKCWFRKPAFRET